MPVWKHRSVADLGPAPVSDSPADNLRAAVELMEVCRGLSGWRPHRGVHRHRAVDAPAEPTRP
jgi:hypothetical protein